MASEHEERLNYLDFELKIGAGNKGKYPVEVINSPAGQASETMCFPFDEQSLRERLNSLSSEASARDFGEQLFNSLFSGEVRGRYDVSLQIARSAGKGLRLKLRIQALELNALPWELLYDPRSGEFVSLSRHVPLVRYPEIPRPIEPLQISPPLRILGMVVSPSDLMPLNVEQEKQRVEKALEGLQSQGLVKLEWLTGQTWRDLQQAMKGGPWHVFHFIGHGGFDQKTDGGFIVLADEKGKPHRLWANELSRLLADHRSLRLVLLNSCEGARGGEGDIFSSTAATLVRRGIPAVVAMQDEITDGAASEFSHAFYEALADGLPVDAAVTEARKAISLAVSDAAEWAAPALFLRSPDGVLFNLPQKEATAMNAGANTKEQKGMKQETPSAAPNNEPKKWWQHPQLWWVPIIVALIALAGVIFTTIVDKGDKTPTPTQNFTYQIRVQAKDTGEYLLDAKVIIEVVGKAPLDSITDANGLARILVSSSHVNQPGMLIVEAKGYKRYMQNIDLIKDSLPHTVQLELEP